MFEAPAKGNCETRVSMYALNAPFENILELKRDYA